MPVEYRIDVAARRVFARAWGAFDLREYSASMLQLTREPSYEPNFSFIVDGLRMEESSTPLEDLEAFGETFEELRNAMKGKMAVVAHGAMLLLGELTGAFMDAQGIQIRTFSDVASAEAWLDGQD